jgi:hypothetical protein
MVILSVILLALTPVKITGNVLLLGAIFDISFSVKSLAGQVWSLPLGSSFYTINLFVNPVGRCRANVRQVLQFLALRL